MENLLSSAPSHTTLPDRFVFPSDQRPPASSSFAVSLPVIDLHAGKDLGFFQVVNHGVPAETMRDMEAACEEFFRLPVVDKADFYSEDTGRPNRLISSTVYQGRTQ